MSGDIKLCRAFSNFLIFTFQIQKSRKMQFLFGSYTDSIMPMIYWSIFFNVSTWHIKLLNLKTQTALDFCHLAAIKRENHLHCKVEERSAPRDQALSLVGLGRAMLVYTQLNYGVWLDQCGTRQRH